MQHKLLTLATLLTVALVLSARVSSATAFQDVAEQYEQVRLLLLDDTLAGVSVHAESIASRAVALNESFSAEEAGVPEDAAEACRELLPELAAAATDLAAATSIDVARELFYELSKPLGRYRKMAGIEGSMVVYCPMVKKAWVQPEGEIGNPYGGQEMPTCGRVIADQP